MKTNDHDLPNVCLQISRGVLIGLCRICSYDSKSVRFIYLWMTSAIWWHDYFRRMRSYWDMRIVYRLNLLCQSFAWLDQIHAQGEERSFPQEYHLIRSDFLGRNQMMLFKSLLSNYVFFLLLIPDGRGKTSILCSWLKRIDGEKWRNSHSIFYPVIRISSTEMLSFRWKWMNKKICSFSFSSFIK